MRIMKKILLLLLVVLLLFCTACGGGKTDSGAGNGGGTGDGDTSQTENPNGGEPEKPDETDYTLAENYDFGDSATWAGTGTVSTDLGDCIMDVYPYDERYDWGQSIMYDEEEGIYKMWWCRHSGFDSIWYAESEDMKNWHSLRKLLAPETNTTWIKLHVGKPTVLKLNGKYIMYFEAPATLRGGAEFDNNVFMAKSDDGKQWHVLTEKDINPSKADANDSEPYPVIRMTSEQMAASWEQACKPGGSGYGFYGIGQPSAVYRNGTYYLYCTYTMEAGDRMYLFRSSDGINFDSGVQVFLRAGSGVKYNTLTNKFMMAYEYTQGTASRVYYMESTDGISFTYSDYASAAQNKNILSRGVGAVRGYPDFVHDGTGNVNTHTVYVSYMEGTMADTGKDWRQYSHTWDIHIAMFNPAEFANRTQVLPNGRVYGDTTAQPYRASHIQYDDRLVGIDKKSENAVIDGIRDALYDSAAVLDIDRAVCADRSIPGDTTAQVRVFYTDRYIFILAEVSDKTANDDFVSLIFAESKDAANTDALYIKATRTEVKVASLANRNNPVEIDGLRSIVTETEKGYNLEVRIPWRNKTPAAYDTVAFDCYVFDNWVSTAHEWKSTIAWQDINTSYNHRKAGELYFKE